MDLTVNQARSMLDAAIFGVGNWGQRLVCSVQGTSSKIRFVRGVVRDPEKVSAFADEQGFAVVRTYDEVLHDEGIQAVVLATPHSMHGEHVTRAARAGKHVFVEKPFTLSGASARIAAGACAQAGVVLAVAQSRRFRPAIIALKQLLRAGELGEILHVEGNFSGPAAYRHASGAWRGSKEENPAGGMAARGIHVLDAFIDMFGPVASVQCLSERRVLQNVTMDDTTAALLRFANGVTGYLCTIMATSQLWRIHVFGSEGSAEMNGEHVLILRQLDGSSTTRTFQPSDTLRDELECFADAVEGRANFPVSPDQAVHGVAVMEAIARSAQSEGAATAVD